MIRKTSRKWFEVWGHEQAQNVVLKGLLTLFLPVCGVQAIVLVLLCQRAPLIVTIGPGETTQVEPSKPSDALLQEEAKRAALQYVGLHHNWDASSIGTQHEKAEKYVAADFVASFRKANANQLAIARDKHLSQHFFVTQTLLTWDDKSIVVEGHRLLDVAAVTAANRIKLRLKFEMGRRTASNPEGIYFTSEDLLESGGNSK